MDNKYDPLTITYTFDTDKESLWKAWTEPEEFSKWWSPDMFTIPRCELDVRPGGKIVVDMKGPDGTVYPSLGEYRDVIVNEKLSFTNTPLDSNGNKLFEVLQTIVFNQTDNKTTLTITAEVLNATPEAKPYLAGMKAGLEQALGKLAQFVKA